ncbi:MAG: Na+/H+ antiporter NhaA [Gaiellaceae bacterium]
MASETQPPAFSGRTAWARSVQTPLREFLRTETGGAAVLLAATVAALAWVNVDPSSYESLWDTTLFARALSLARCSANFVDARPRERVDGSQACPAEAEILGRPRTQASFPQMPTQPTLRSDPRPPGRALRARQGEERADRVRAALDVRRLAGLPT